VARGYGGLTVSLCVISQPRLFPGLHYLHRMMVADLFVIFDSVQYNPRHEENRTRLKSPGGPQWLTVPMRRLSREQRICDTRIDNSQPWRRKAVKTLSTLYGRAPYYKAYAPEIASIIQAPHATLTQLDRASWMPALQPLAIACEFILSSELPVSSRGSRLLLDICKYLDADTYLSGAFGRDYLDISQFTAEGVTVLFHEYSYPVYPQRFGDFVPFLSYLDMLFNAGLERDKVLAGGKILPA
jgi:hypothetical protein